MRTRNFYLVTLADFIVRTAYQMGKTPLLPVFAAGLGATNVLLGLIVSVSTLTGMLLKPFVGLLSDRWGRRSWLLVGTAFFAFMPFVYRFVSTPEQLFGVRTIHGLATAIYGPVTLAYIVEQAGPRRAEGLGWFGIARSGGYIVGPALAGWLLLSLTPEQVFTITGLMACTAFAPIFFLGDSVRFPAASDELRRPFRTARRGLSAAAQTPALWLAGGLEFIAFMGLYAAKAFLPVYAIDSGINIALIGSFFALQESVHVLGRPLAGRWADLIGYSIVISLGMLLIAAALALLTVAPGGMSLLGLAAVLGGGQALVFPATTALLAVQLPPAHLGAGMGLLGSMQNAGKVAGPIVAGLLLVRMGYGRMFLFMGAILCAGAAFWLVGGSYYRWKERLAAEAEAEAQVEAQVEAEAMILEQGE